MKRGEPARFTSAPILTIVAGMKQGRVFLGACAAFLFILSVNVGRSENWPAWRGPAGQGICRETDLPLRWSTNENIRWRVPLPDRGNSTPIIWDRRIFVTQALAREGRRTLMCFDRADGNLLWQAGTAYTEEDPTHDTNPHCSASPVTDGERVIASFGSAGLFCYDLNGKELWRRELGKQTHIWGNGSSPVIHDDLCILNFGPGERMFLIALDKRTGRTIWQVDEPGGHSGFKGPGEEKAPWIGSWSTPVITEGAEQLLIMSWPNRLCALDPKSGKELWTCSGLNPLVYTSPLVAKEIAVAMGGFNGMALAARLGGKGGVTETHRLWHHPRSRQRIGSGVVHNGHVFILDEPGIALCLELETGRKVWEERLRGPGPDSSSWSSLVLSGDTIYAMSKSADAFILKAGPEFELLATNSLGERTMSSIAVSDGELFIRTYQALWCVGKSPR